MGLTNIKNFDFCHFSQKIPLLVSCCSFCSFELTEDLTGLHGIPTSDWLHVNCFTRTSRGWERVPKQARLLVLPFFSTFCQLLPGKKLEAGSFLHSHLPITTILSSQIGPKKRNALFWKYIYYRENVLVTFKKYTRDQFCYIFFREF